jgi:hypothetical protein
MDGRPVPSRSKHELSRSWVDPCAFVDVVGIDFGAGDMHLYSSATGRAWKVPASSAIAEILSLQRGTLVCGESAHLATPRTGKSLAQPFTGDNLLALYSDAKAAGITIKLFPHYHSGTRVRAWAAANYPDLHSAEKSDAADAASIARYVSACNAISLANPPKSFARDSKRDYGSAVREYSSIALNAERTTKYRGVFFPHLIELGIEIYRHGGRRIGQTACHSIASLIATEANGSPVMFVRNSLPPGVETWWRHVARMTPFHHKGGLARSNLMRHSFRPFVRKFGKREGVSMGSGTKLIPFGDHDDQQAMTRTRAMKSYRDTAKACYRLGVGIAASRGFGTLDPLKKPFQCESEAKDGQ